MSADREVAPNDVGSLRAELTGSDTCTAAGLTVHARAPVLTMCREMLAAGLDPDRALDVYRNDVLALRIRAIGEAAKLTVEECRDGVPRFRPYRPYPSAGSPPMRQTETPASRVWEAPESAATAIELAEVGG